MSVDEDIIHSWDILDMLFTVFEFVYWGKGTCDVEWEVWDFVLGLLIEMRSSRIRYRLGKRLKKLVFCAGCEESEMDRSRWSGGCCSSGENKD